MRENVLEQEDKKPKRTSLSSLSAMAGGAAMMGLAAVGVLSNEAKTQEEAFMSLYFGEEHVYYIESEELPYVALGAAGLVIFAAGALSRKNEEE